MVSFFSGPQNIKRLYPIFIDLKRYSGGRKQVQDTHDAGSLLQQILQAGGAPRRTLRELERLAKEGRVLALIDGLNEVSSEIRMKIVDYFLSVNREGACYLLVTDRFGPPDSILESFSHAVVDRLDQNKIQTIFDGEFGTGEYNRLDESQKEMYTRPFFLSLAVKRRYKFSGVGVSSNIFEQFFLDQLRINKEQLNQIARASVEAISQQGGFDMGRFKQLLVNGGKYQILVAAAVLNKEESDFEHYLWRDYLVSRYLAQNEEYWTEKVFDSITTYSSSLECLSLVVEQLADRARKDSFLKKVFDWNYFAAADCIADFREEDPPPRQLSEDIRAAILGAIGEKRFDIVQRTKERANGILSGHNCPFAKGFREANNMEALVEHIETISGQEGWFKDWKTLFTKGKGSGLSIEEINSIDSDDSLIGWTVANAGRRVIIDETGQRHIREIYEKAIVTENKNSVRWRVVHILGAFPSDVNVDFLLKALNRDTYHWVKYGAARSLIEIASRSPVGLRDSVISELKGFINHYNPSNVWVRRHFLREVIEVAFLLNSEPGWKEAITPLLTIAMNKEADPSYRSLLKAKVGAFSTYDITG